MKPPVMLTYGWVRSTYAALRNFCTHGIPVFVGDTGNVGMCQWSSCKKAFVRYPHPFKNEPLFINTLVDFINKNNIRMLLPSHDETMIIARHAEAIPDFCALPITSFALLDLANNKSETQKFAETIGVSTARRILYDTVAQLSERLREYPNFPLVIRLRKSNSAKGVFYSRGAEETVSTVDTLIKKHTLDPDRFPVVQEQVNGEGWGVSCLYWEGKRIAHFTHRRLREKTVAGGTSTLREHQPNTLLEEMAFAMLDNLAWHGMAMVEFKYNPETKQAWFIEINPRLWGSIHLSISAGVEFPWLLYLCATEGAESAVRYHQSATIRYPWKARWYIGDCMAALGSFKRGKLVEGLCCMLPGGTDTYDDIDLSDPGAFFGECAYYLHGFIQSGSINPVEEGMIG